MRKTKLIFILSFKNNNSAKIKVLQIIVVNFNEYKVKIKLIYV